MFNESTQYEWVIIAVALPWREFFEPFCPVVVVVDFSILILNVSFYPPLVGNPNQKLLHLALWTWVGSSSCIVHTLIFQLPCICVANITEPKRHRLFQIGRELEEDKGIWLNEIIFHLYLDLLQIRGISISLTPKPPFRGPISSCFRSLLRLDVVFVANPSPCQPGQLNVQTLIVALPGESTAVSCS